MNHLKELIRAIPDYPKPGILFYDLTTLLQNQAGFHALVDNLCDHYAGNEVDAVVGIEARGFILAPALAYRLNAGFIPVRKSKKLPWKTVAVTYQLEYGTDTLEIHQDAIKAGQRVLISDDLLSWVELIVLDFVNSRWRTASKRTTPAATDTFNARTGPVVAIETRKSQRSRTSACNPFPSPPNTIPTGTLKSTAVWRFSARSPRPTSQ